MWFLYLIGVLKQNMKGGVRVAPSASDFVATPA